ncbi:MAG: hypothetical protein ACKOCB_09430 [Planctomycetia bacterium]
MNRRFTMSLVVLGVAVATFASMRLALADGAPPECHGEVRVIVAQGADATNPAAPKVFVDFTCHGECILGPQVCHPFNDPARNMAYCACWYDANHDGVAQANEVVVLRCCDVNAGTDAGGAPTGAFGCISEPDCCVSPATCKLTEIGRVANPPNPPNPPTDTVTLTCKCR